MKNLKLFPVFLQPLLDVFSMMGTLPAQRGF